jgi:cytochrome c biogenesis protein CcmG/thiol:disulfide interchange protein DsbE
MAKPKKKQPEKVGIDSISQPNTKAIVLGVIGVIVALALVAVGVTVLNKDDSNDASDDVVEFRPVTTTGDALPSQYSDEQGTQLNEAVGAQAPDLNGSDFKGTSVNITKDGRGKAIVFAAHWCPHCQKEVPLLADWIAANKAKYPNVDFYMVATASTPQRANFPPSAWLSKVKWPAPIIADDNAYDAAKAYGLGSYPYMVFLDGQNKVVTRTSGELAMTDYANLVQRTQDAVKNNAAPSTTTTAPGETTTTQAPASKAGQ